MELTLAESVLLLALDDATESLGIRGERVLAGALLVDLARVGALRAQGAVLRPVPGVGIKHPVLARVYTTIVTSSKPRSAYRWVGRLPRELIPLTGTVAGPLVDRGVLTEQRTMVLRFFTSICFPEADPGPKRELRSRLWDLLGGTRTPQEFDALLLGLLEELSLVEPLVERYCWHAKKRAKEAMAATAGTHPAVREIRAMVSSALSEDGG